MKGKLVRLKSNNNNLRTKEVEGEYEAIPEVGKTFVIIGESLTVKPGLRWVETSIVETSEKLEDRIRFTTLNSIYELFEEQ